MEKTNDQQSLQPTEGPRGSLGQPRIPGGSAVESSGKTNLNGIVNPRGTVQVFDKTSGDPVDILGNDQVGNVTMEVLKDTMREKQQTAISNTSDLNGTVTSGQAATVNPNLGNVYELQFRMMHKDVGALEQNVKVIDEANMMSKGQNEKAIVPKAVGVIESLPMACALGTNQVMQLQLNVPLKTHIQTLHDLVTHNVAHVEMAFMEQQQLEKQIMSLLLRISNK